MNEIKEKYLPVGTVVLLKNGKKRVMITGFCVTPQGKNEAYDYCGCLYPEGFLTSNQNCLFNHNQIDKIFYMGLIDEEEINFKKQLKSLIDMADQFSKFKNNDSTNEDSTNNSPIINEEVNKEEEIVQDEKVDINFGSTENVVNTEIETNEVSNEEIINDSGNEVEENNGIVDDSVFSFNIADESFSLDNNEKEENKEIETLDDFIS